MTYKISIGLALANLPEACDAEEIMQFIANSSEDYDTYTLAPAPPGTIRGAAIDIALVGTAGSIASIARLLWMAYDKFIAQRRRKDQDDAGIYIVIHRPDGTIIEFWIGKTHKDRGKFIEEFTKQVLSIQKEDDPEFWANKVGEIEESETWVRQKR